MLAGVRERLESRFRPARLALWMTLSGLAPYCVYTVPNGLFDAHLFVVLVAVSAAVSYWFVAFPRGAPRSSCLSRSWPPVALSPLFPAIYGKPWPKLQLAILGQLMWTRLARLRCFP